MSELELLVDYYIDTERQGPGSVEETIQALNLININPRQQLNIADLGCGSGGQTITLAKNINAQITAIDFFRVFLDELNERAKKLGLQDKIITRQESMENLTFENEELDIIWSEGAIYNIGFENGIRDWRKYLKRGGYLAVSELTWTTDTRPKEIEDYWNKEYPEIDTASNKIKILEQHGYAPIGYFVLSQESWSDNYYKPLENRYPNFLEKHKHSKISKKIVKDLKDEIRQFEKFKDFYNYGFYIAKKL